MCILCGNDEHHPWEARGKAVWGWGRWGVLFSRPNCRFTIRKVCSRKTTPTGPTQPPPTTSSPTHLHDPSREPHPHASLSIRSMILLAGRDGAGSGAPVPTMCGQPEVRRVSTAGDTTASAASLPTFLPTLSAGPPPAPTASPSPQTKSYTPI
jgi:hypothetical protein